MKFRVHLNLSSVTKPVIHTLKIIATFIFFSLGVHTQDLGQSLEILDTMLKVISDVASLGYCRLE